MPGIKQLHAQPRNLKVMNVPVKVREAEIMWRLFNSKKTQQKSPLNL